MQPANSATALRGLTVLIVGLILVLQTVIAAPINDNFADQTQLTGTNILISASLADANQETDEPLLPEISSGQSGWWTWTAPENGSVTISATGTNFDALVSVYVGQSLNQLSLIASNSFLICYQHAECGCHWRTRPSLTFHVAAGESYRICVDAAIVTDAQWNYTTTPFLLAPSIESDDIILESEHQQTQSHGDPHAALFPPTFLVPSRPLAPPSPSPVITTNIPPAGDLALGLNFTPAPINDDFENRTVLSGARLHISASNKGAGAQLAEPSYLREAGGSSLWYSWTAPASGRVTISTSEIPAFQPSQSSWPPTFPGPGSGNVDTMRNVDVLPSCGQAVEANPLPTFFPLFAVYTGTNLDSLEPASWLPKNMSAFPNAIEFDAVKGQTYQIAFDGNQGTTANITMYLALTVPANNDSFEHRIRLRGVAVLATGYNAGATRQSDEPVLDGATGKTVWWSWIAPVSGNVSVSLGGSDYVFPVGVFSGNSVAALQSIASGSGGLSFYASQGHTYQIAVSDLDGLTGLIRMAITAPIHDVSLIRTMGNSKAAILRYRANPGDVILLLQAAGGYTWRPVKTVVARSRDVEFFVQPGPATHGPWYRAILFDRSNLR